jgi:Uma2 family endonuclease
MWSREATLTRGDSVRLVIEVVSTNWKTDHARKSEDYEAMGIAEYWIVDHSGLGGKKYIGFPKHPTLSVYTLIDGEYQVTRFRERNCIVSLTFPDLNLTAEQVLNSGRA